MANALQKRFWFVLILFSILAIFASVTIPKSPYFLFSGEQPSKVVYVAARQFYYVMSYQAIDPASPTGESSIELNTNELVEFRVTSLDVNHGFAIYSPHNELIAQTQAMPGYVNRLRWKFSEPGLYTVYCLEYCGMAHQAMKTTITVK
ncbi:MAG: cytochrome C oxidase subunit II [Bacteroidales bacterium]|nr:cytochrome C oxidase subunit II [Bacteroidales bacterium]